MRREKEEGQVFLHCCSCSRKWQSNKKVPCHHYKLIFTDGACKQNGRLDATAGIGVAYSSDEMSQFSTPIDAMIDGAQKRTSQRAELIAACYGLRYWVREQYDIDELLGEAQKRKKPARPHGSSTDPAALVVATDSEYAVKGMTEWLPKWKVSHH